MRHSTWPALLTIVLAGAAVARAVPPLSVVLRTGDRVADGRGVSSIGVPVAGAGNEVFFRGATNAVLELDGGVVEAVAACGDALPPPYQGTFGSFIQVEVNDAGAVAFTAELDGPGLVDGLFLRAGGTLTPVSIDGLDSGFGPGTGQFTLDRQGDIVTLSSRFVRRWTRATGATEVLAMLPPKSAARFVSRPAIDDGGRVAWLARATNRRGSGGVYTWQPGVGLRTAVDEPATLTAQVGVRNSDIAINASGAVAWVSTSGSTGGAFLWDPETHVTTRIARVGDVVGGSVLSGFRRYVGIDSQGTVLLLGRLKGAGTHLLRWSGGVLTSLAAVSGTDFPGRLPDSGRIAWTENGELRTYDGEVETVLTRADSTPIGTAIVASGASVNDAGAVAFLASHEALLRLANGVAAPVAEAGEQVPGGGGILALGQYQAGAGALAFFARTSDERTALLRRSASGLALLAIDGGSSPGGGTYTLEEEPGSQQLAVGDAGVAFSSRIDDGSGLSSAQGVFVAAAKKTRSLVRRGDAAPGGGRFDFFGGALAVGDGVAFGAYLAGDPQPYGLFWSAHRRTTRIAVTGDDVPGMPGRVFTFVGVAAAAGDRVLFVAHTGVDDLPGLFLWTHGRVTRLRTDATSGGPLPDPFVFEGPIALAGRQAYVGGRIGGVSSLYRVGRRVLQPLLAGADLSALGGTLVVGQDATTDAATFGYAVSPRGDRLTVVAPVESGGARGVVLSRPLAGGR